MRLHLLGPIEADADGRPIPLGGAKQRAVLAMLALEPNRVVSADRLIEGLWGEAVPASAQKLVQHYVWQLRRTLDGNDAEIVTRGRGYVLRVEAEAIDAARFERLVTDAEKTDGAARDALALWRGPPLDDLADEPFAAAEIRRLEELKLRAVELAVDADLAAGRHRDLVGELGAIVAEHPLSEGLHVRRVLALYRSGRQAEALEAYRAARAALVEEAGIEPGPELRALHEAVLRQDPGLELAEDVARRRTAGEPRRERVAPDGVRVAAPDGRRRRARLLAGAGLLAAAIVGFLVLLRSGDDGLRGIDEDAIGRIDTQDGRIAAQYAVGRAPGPVVAGGGSVWAASGRDRTITRAGEGSDRVVTIDAGGVPVALGYGAGSLWIADDQARRVVRIDARTNRAVQSFALGNVPRAIAVGYGAVWVATAVDGAVTRIDLRSGAVSRPVPIGTSPTALAVGAGALWAVSESAGAILRLDPRTGAVLRTSTVGAGPSAIAVGAGAAWVANREDGTLSRVDAGSGAVTDTLPVGRAPAAVTTGANAVWVANAEDRTVSRIDAATRRVTRTVDVGREPTGLALAGRSLWVSAGARPAEHRGGTLRVGVEGPFERLTLDPAELESYAVTSWNVMSVAYDGLVGYRRAGGAAGGVLVPALATNLPRPVDGGRTYVFTLRPGLRYADGTAVRAEDVRTSLERVLRTVGAAIPGFFERIRGARRCVERPRDCDLSKGIRTDGRTRTVTVRLTSPDPELLHKLALPFAFVMPAGRRPAPGTGPYRIATTGPRRARLTRNPRFGEGSSSSRPAGFAETIEVALGRTSGVDVLTQFAVPNAARFRALTTQYGGRLRVDTALETEYLFLNTTVPPFDDVRVRRALNLAVDRRRALEVSGGSAAGVTTCRMLPPGLPGHRPACPFRRDLAAARRLVAASGTRGDRVAVWSPPATGPIARYLAGVLRDLGYRSRVRPEANVDRYFARVADPRAGVQAGITLWVADYLASANVISANFGCDQRGATNFSQLCDQGLERLIARARGSREPAEATVAWDAVERRLAALAPVVPLFHTRAVSSHSERSDNLQHHPLWGPLLDQVWVR